MIWSLPKQRSKLRKWKIEDVRKRKSNTGKTTGKFLIEDMLPV